MALIRKTFDGWRDPVQLARRRIGDGTTVSEYNASTGTLESVNFLTGVPSGTTAGPIFLAAGNNILYVPLNAAAGIATFDATTGALINGDISAGLGSFNAGLGGGMTLLGNDLFFNDSSGNYEIDVTNPGIVQNSFLAGGAYGIAVASVPEPSGWSMITVGGVALLGMMYRKKHRTAQKFFLRSIKRNIDL